jgi:hypothetical protein
MTAITIRRLSAIIALILAVASLVVGGHLLVAAVIFLSVALLI